MIAPPQRDGRNRIWQILETGVLDHKSLIKDTTWLVCMNILCVYPHCMFSALECTLLAPNRRFSHLSPPGPRVLQLTRRASPWEPTQK